VYERKRRQKGQWELEMNHSHYLMLDDGTIRYYDIEDYRTRLAIHLARLQHDDGITSEYMSLYKNQDISNRVTISDRKNRLLMIYIVYI
jgi:hypothetical protein